MTLPDYPEATGKTLTTAPPEAAFAACGVREIDERGGTHGRRDKMPPPPQMHRSLSALAKRRREPGPGVRHDD